MIPNMFKSDDAVHFELVHLHIVHIYAHTETARKLHFQTPAYETYCKVL